MFILSQLMFILFHEKLFVFVFLVKSNTPRGGFKLKPVVIEGQPRADEPEDKIDIFI